MGFDPTGDYPLGARRPDLVRTPGGLQLRELALDSARIDAAELRATPETLRLQAEVARAAGRTQLADNLLRAAELAPLADETILEIYTAMRPRRSSAAELEAWAERLGGWDAPVTAAFVREAARVYSGSSRPRHRAARPVRAYVRTEEAARAAHAGEPGARHEPEGESGASRGGRGGGGGARLRGDPDDGRRVALRWHERNRDPR